MTVRARFAPAPTGDLHVGNVRTALFNWLFCRNHGGTFVLRIEDTDPERAKAELIEPIYDALRWLGLDWDEGPDVGGPHGPYRQSERLDLHVDALRQLEAEGKAYRCYCTREDIVARGTKTGYDRYCRTRRDVPPEGTPYALRFAVPEGDAVVVPDLVRGEVRTPYEDMQDFIVARSDGSPTFVIANVVDDMHMEITHAIRGTDLLNAAAQNTLLFRALGAEPPAYAHVPLLLGTDRSRLGARHGAVGILTYRQAGYLSEAMLNYLALLGWSTPAGDELLSRDRIVSEFTLDRVQPSGAIFDLDKLGWMNQEYIKGLPPDELERRVLELYPEAHKETLHKVIELGIVRTRAVTLTDIRDSIRYLHTRPQIDPAAAEKWLGTTEASRTLEAVASRLQSLEPWEPGAIGEAVQDVIAELGLHRKKGPKPLFVAIAGSEVALPLYDSMFIIGRDEAVARLRASA